MYEEGSFSTASNLQTASALVSGLELIIARNYMQDGRGPEFTVILKYSVISYNLISVIC